MSILTRIGTNSGGVPQRTMAMEIAATKPTMIIESTMLQRPLTMSVAISRITWPIFLTAASATIRLRVMR